MKVEHYSQRNPEPIDVISEWGLNFNLGNVIKYIARAGNKQGESKTKDLMKADDYLRYEIRKIMKEEQK